MTRPYRVLLFDLFGTVVHFRTPPPGPGGPAFEWLREPLAAACPALTLERFAAALLAVSRAINGARAPQHREVPSRERFRRALARLDPSADHAHAAQALSLAHMTHLTAQTELPAAHGPLLRELAGRYRLGLVSNFDHGPTARAILARDAIDTCFEAVVISDDVGRRKPHPAVFAAALERLGAAPAQALYVGDTHADDVVGALGAGLDVAWINRHGADVPEPPPTFVIETLAGLHAVLSD